MAEADLHQPIDFTHAGSLGDALFAVGNHWRETDPIRWDEGANCWVVTRHDDILDAFSGRLPLSNLRLKKVSLDNAGPGDLAALIPNLIQYSPYHPTNMDAPQHPRLRKLLTKAFGRSVVESLREFARGRVAELMDLIASKDMIEFNEEIGRALPGSVIIRLLGLPEHLYPNLRDWATDVMTGLGTPNPLPEWVAGADRAFAEMTVHFKEAITERRANPRGPDDFLTALIQAREGADALSDDEIVGTLQTALIAGHDTTGNSMTMGVAALANHPEAWAEMRAHPERALQHITEIMRFTAMSAAQNRVASADFEWRGKQIKAGDVVFILISAGNRDPRAFENPEALDLNRTGNDRSLTFAPGVHHCIGHLLAKMQLTEFFTALTQRFDGAEIIDERIVYSEVLVFRGIPTLNMRFYETRASKGLIANQSQ